jgi:transposase
MARKKIQMHQYRQALLRMRQGESNRTISDSKLMGRKTASHLRELALTHGWLDKNNPLPEDREIAQLLGNPKRAQSTISTLESHRDLILKWHESKVSGVVIHAALKRDFGWTGSYSSVRRMLQEIKKSEPAKTTWRLHFEPGEAVQVDFGQGPLVLHPDGKLKRTWAFVMTLCYSRHQYVEFVWDQTVPTWLACHKRAFEWFGGVPSRVIIDNAKCAITKACRFDPVVQRSYAECAEGYGFKIDPCPPHDPQKKGIVESGVKYLKTNFIPLRTFRALEDLNAQAQRWVMLEAGIRQHGTTREEPLTLFETEKPLLLALPSVAPIIGAWSQVTVHPDCHVKFDNALYSVPYKLVGQQVWLQSTDTVVMLYFDHQLMATHARSKRAGTRTTVADHMPPNVQAFFSKDRDWLIQRAKCVGPACENLVFALLKDKIVERLRGAQGVIGLTTQYNATRVEAACAMALAHGSGYYKTVKGILKTGADLEQQMSHLSEPVYKDARFIRPASSLFQ